MLGRLKSFFYSLLVATQSSLSTRVVTIHHFLSLAVGTWHLAPGAS